MKVKGLRSAEKKPVTSYFSNVHVATIVLKTKHIPTAQ